MRGDGTVFDVGDFNVYIESVSMRLHAHLLLSHVSLLSAVPSVR